MPQEIDELTRRLTQLQIEEQVLQKEKDNPTTKSQLDAVRSQIAELQEKISGLKAQWESEKAVITQINDLKKRLEDERENATRAEREGNLNRAAELSYGSIPQLQREIDAATAKLAEMQKGGAL